MSGVFSTRALLLLAGALVVWTLGGVPPEAASTAVATISAPESDDSHRAASELGEAPLEEADHDSDDTIVEWHRAPIVATEQRCTPAWAGRVRSPLDPVAAHAARGPPARSRS